VSVNDYAAIWQINQAAFGSDAEANLVNALRAGGYAMVFMVAELDGGIVGHILFSQLAVDQVTPRYHRSGLIGAPGGQAESRTIRYW
jgi:putative acetyltransferase